MIGIAAPANAASKKAPPPGGAGTLTTLVAGGLDNPRGIAFGPGNRLVVAEAGTGGGECVSAPDPESGEETEQCVGATGRISSIDTRNGTRRTLVGGLPSLADPS